MTDLEIRVLSLIPHGSERPRNTSEIAKLLKIDDRKIRKIIRRLIMTYGVAIVAKRGTNSGVYIPLNDTERLEGIVELRAQHKAEGERLDSLITADLNRAKEILEEYAG